MSPPIGSARDLADRLAGAALRSVLRLPGVAVLVLATMPTVGVGVVRVAGALRREVGDGNR